MKMAGLALCLLGFGTVVLGSSASALAAPAGKANEERTESVVRARTSRVVWTDVTIASREKRPQLERFLKQIIERQTRKANWGARRESPIEARIDVTEFSAVLTKDVVRVTCTGMGKLKGGQSVRSHFSMGGRPAGRAELERQLLTMLGRGIVSRLAEIARASRPAS
jgi:hypothetical protein